ncbi:MAG TPA: hypothetical protein VIU12_17455 [Chryseolinea sp.]
MRTTIAALLIAYYSAATAWTQPDFAGDAQLTIHAFHEDGTPVKGAKVTVSFNQTENYWQEGHKFAAQELITNNAGTVVASGKTTTGWISYAATKDGYYRTYGERLILKRNGDRYEPWNPAKEMILKPIWHPIPMYARKVDTGIPSFNTPLHYDLNVGDWVAPQGKGKVTDIIFTAKLEQRSELDYNYTLTVSFPNRGDGIQVFNAPIHGSELRSPRYAPTGGYHNEWVQTRNRRSGQMEYGNYALDGDRNISFVCEPCWMKKAI